MDPNIIFILKRERERKKKSKPGEDSINVGRKCAQKFFILKIGSAKGQLGKYILKFLQ